jgi:hypothetical protein
VADFPTIVGVEMKEIWTTTNERRQNATSRVFLHCQGRRLKVQVLGVVFNLRSWLALGWLLFKKADAKVALASDSRDESETERHNRSSSASSQRLLGSGGNQCSTGRKRTARIALDREECSRPIHDRCAYLTCLMVAVAGLNRRFGEGVVGRGSLRCDH